MRVYTCTHCGNTLYFENSKCLHCGHAVGFDPATLTMITLVPDASNSSVFSHSANASQQFVYCANAVHGVCNWLLPAGPEPGFCVACAMNRVIPDLDSAVNQQRWKAIEVAKHRLVYSLLRLRLPLATGEGPTNANTGAVAGAITDAATGAVTETAGPERLQFSFMADGPGGERVMTGHDQGLITLNIAEADETERTKHKHELGERYRTLLGHFRHESGHFYWDALVRDKPAVLKKYRQLFGDDRQDYAAALSTYYEQGAPADWVDRFVSPYATAHPWEDWAESWAHYLHMMDTLETAWSFGIKIDPVEQDQQTGIRASILKEPYGMSDFTRIINRWLPLCFAVNSLNRSMGHADFYPFVLSPVVIDKLAFIHKLCMAELRPKPVKPGSTATTSISPTIVADSPTLPASGSSGGA